MGTVTEKQERLLEALGGMSSVIVAYSGGADSAYLAWAAQRALGDRAVAIVLHIVRIIEFVGRNVLVAKPVLPRKLLGVGLVRIGK